MAKKKDTDHSAGLAAGADYTTVVPAATAPHVERPLFVPLNRQFFEAFADGSKRDELRRYGPRWNEGTCRVGREVVLSLGYGRQARLRGRIWKFKKQHGATFGSTYRKSIEQVFGTLDIHIACISIELRTGPPRHGSDSR